MKNTVGVLILVGVMGCGPIATVDLSSSALTSDLAETFESGSKSGYAGGDVNLSSGVWFFDDALVGTLSSDAKTGARSARIHYSGSLTMEFDQPEGAETFSFSHATFGTDRSGSLEVLSSTDGGGAWTRIGTVQSTSTSLQTAHFEVAFSGPVRFAIRKIDGGSNRINIDDISVTVGAAESSTKLGAEVSVHTTLGLPGPADASSADRYLSVKAQYVLSYNGFRKVPNWVSWELNSSYLGSQSRANNFRPDGTIPSFVPQANLSDYSGSGFDRGHMCPSGDRTRSYTANSETFYLINMVPQAANNNRGPWEKLESYSRELAQQGKELFVVSGGIFTDVSGTIGNGVSVPDTTFKVIVVLDQNEGAADVTNDSRVISVIMPNDNNRISIGDDWRSYRVSVRDIEQQTELNFLSDVSTAVQDVVETRIDDQ